MPDLLFCAHYPFTQEAKDYVTGKGLTLTSSLVEKAEMRVREALSTGKLRRVAELSDSMEEELVCYAGARMIVSAAANRYLINRYSVAEAKRASNYLSSDDNARHGHVDAVAKEFGVEFTREGDRYKVSLASYLSFTPRSVDYKLANREVSQGFVAVKRQERIRILEEAIRKRIEGSLPIKADFSPDIKEAAARMLALLPKLEIASMKVGQENYPPCMKKLIDDLAVSVNLPHTARVALAIYLVSAGVPTAVIVNYFRGAPDFSEKTTTYQVEHIRARKYTTPACSTMDSWGTCIAICRCGNPINFRDATHGARLRRSEAEKKD